MGDGDVKVLRRVGAHPNACSRGDCHSVLSLRDIDFLTNGASPVTASGFSRRAIVRCLVCLAKLNGKDTANESAE